MRRPLMVLLCVSSFLLTGCNVMSEGKRTAKTAADGFAPRSRDLDSDDNRNGGEYVDPWRFVGKEGRADEQMEHESDGLTKYMSSPKARAIERNLGID